MKHEKLRDISGILHTDRNHNPLHKCKPAHMSRRQWHKWLYVMLRCVKCKTPLSSPPASDDSPLMHLAQHNHLTSGLNTHTHTDYTITVMNQTRDMEHISSSTKHKLEFIFQICHTETWFEIVIPLSHAMWFHKANLSLRTMAKPSSAGKW